MFSFLGGIIRVNYWIYNLILHIDLHFFVYYILYYERFLKTVRQTIEQFASITVKRFLFYLYIIIYSVYNSQSETVVCINISLNRFGFYLFFLCIFSFSLIFFSMTSPRLAWIYLWFLFVFILHKIYTPRSRVNHIVFCQRNCWGTRRM